MKAQKTIWYGGVPPMNEKGEYEKHAIFDKRIKRIAIGTDVTSEIKDRGVLRRLQGDKLVANEVDPVLAQRAKQEDKDFALKSPKAKPAPDELVEPKAPKA